MTLKQHHEKVKLELELEYKVKEQEFQKAYRKYLLHSLKKDEYGIYLSHDNYEEFRDMAVANGWKPSTS